MRWRTPLIAAVLFASTAFARGGLIVLQVEAAEAGTGRYAPLDFAGSSTALGAGGFAGKRFFALSGTASSGADRGVHAADVAAAFYGPDSPGQSAVSDVYVISSSDFLSRVLLPTRRGRNLPPAKLPGRATVVNASFAGSTRSRTLDGRLLRGADILVSRDAATLVAGAVTSPTGAFSDASLIWGARNVIAVRGDAVESVFNPSMSGVGRAHADLWDSGTASIATARTSSAAAAIIADAQLRNRPELARPPAVRAALLASADRQTKTVSGQAWVPEIPSGLNTTLGAGKLDASAALALSRSVGTRYARVTGWGIARGGTLRRYLAGAQTSADVAVAPKSIGVISVGSRGILATVFRLTETARGAVAALTWDTATRNGAVGDFRLELRTVTLTPKGDAVLSESALAFSDAPSDNVRLLSSDASFDPGLYAWVVRNETSTSARPSLAWTFDTLPLIVPPIPSIPSTPRDLPPPGADVGGSPPTTIPEPSALFALLVPAVLIRRRTRPAHT